jgi:hypothetical protein
VKKLSMGLLALTAIVTATSAAHAKPPFAEKEGVKCSYCHAPSPPKRNYRGDFYKMHEMSFAGFDDAAEAKKAGVPVGADADSKPKSMTPATPPVTPPAPTGDSAAVKAAKAKVASAMAACAKNPKDAKCKVAAGAAHTGLGNAYMAERKYAEALRSFNEALKCDPKNKTAAAAKSQIEKVYKQMGKPIPK